MKRYMIALAIAGVLSLGVVGISQSQFSSPGDALPKAHDGTRNPDAAMKQANQVMKAYLNAGRDWSKVDQKLMILPDQKLAELRNSPGFSPAAEAPYMRSVAFASYTYAFRNLKYEGGDLVTSKPTGFIIVGYENGTVKQVPFSEVRYTYDKVTFDGEVKNIRYHIFPGMPQYASASKSASGAAVAPPKDILTGK